MASFWKKLPPGWRVWEDDEEDPWKDDGEDGGGGDGGDGGDEGGDDSGGDDSGGDDSGGGDWEWSGGEDTGGGGEDTSGGDTGGGEDTGGGDTSWAGDAGGWDNHPDSDGDGLDDNAVAREWDNDRQERERQYDEERARDQFEQEQQRQEEERRQAEEQRAIEENQRRLDEQQRLAEAYRAQEQTVAANLPQIGQATTGLTHNLIGNLLEQPRHDATLPPGYTGLFSPPTTPEEREPRPLQEGAPPVRDDWATRPGGPGTTGPTGIPARDDWSTQPGDHPAPPSSTGPLPAPPVRDDWSRPQQAAAAAAAGAARAGAPLEVVAQTAEQAARIVWDNQTLAQQSAWTRRAFADTYGANAEAEWQRQHRAELARNVALYGEQEPTPRTPARIAGFPEAPNRQIGAVPPPKFGESAQFGLPPRAPSAPVAAAAAAATAPRAAVPTATPPGQAPKVTGPMAPTTLPPTTTPAPSSGGWTPIPGQAPPRSPVTLPPAPAPRPAVPEEPPAQPERPWRPTLPATAPSAIPAETPAETPAEIPVEVAPEAPAEAAPPTAPTGLDDAAAQAIIARGIDPYTGEALYVEASTLPRSDTIKDPSQVQSVTDLSLAVRERTFTNSFGTPSRAYVEPTGDIYQVQSDGSLKWQGRASGAYEASRPIQTVVATDGNGNLTRYSAEDWQAIGPDQQAAYSNPQVVPFSVDPATVNRAPPVPRTDPALTAPGIIPRPEPGQPSATAPSLSDIMNGLIRGVRGAWEGQQPLAPDYRQRGPGVSTLDVGPGAGYDPDAGRAELGNLAPYRPVTSVREALDSQTPLEGLASLVKSTQGQTVTEDMARTDAYHIAQGISALLQGKVDAQGRPEGAWAEPYLNDVARLAWAREERTAGNGGVRPQDAPVEYIEKWKDGFYGQDSRIPLVREINQEMINYGATQTKPGQPFNWKAIYGENGDAGLMQRQATGVDCGPNAFATILRSRGYNADTMATFNFAKQYGYHNGNAFTGPDNMVRMLKSEAGFQDVQKIGINPNGQGWGQIDQELDAGRPVILSSPGHYYVVSAKDPTTGKYYAGATATVIRGQQDWMTPAQFKHEGAADWAIFARDTVNPESRFVQQQKIPPPPIIGTGDTRAYLSTQTTGVTPTPRAGAQVRTPVSQRGEEPGGQIEASYQPEWYRDANPDAGTLAGEGRGRDVGAKVLNTAYQMTGDSRFALLTAGLINGEGGFSGKQDEVGAQGIFQFDPRFAEGKEFSKWLAANNINERPERAARNIDYAMGYYLKYLKDAYDRAVSRGVTDENSLLTAMVKEPSRRGYGHNSGSSGANLMNYINGLQEFKRGQFRLLDRSRW